MNPKLKKNGRKLWAVMMSLLMLFSIVSGTRQAFAAVKNDIFTEMKLTQPKSDALITEPDSSKQMELLAKFAVPNHVVQPGDMTIINIPPELKLVRPETIELKNESNDLIATAKIAPATKTVTITYTDYVANHSDITGSLRILVMIDTEVVKEPGIINPKVVISNDKTFELGPLNYKGILQADSDEVIAKWGSFMTRTNEQGETEHLVQYTIRVNVKGNSYKEIHIKDTIESPALSYVRNQDRIEVNGRNGQKTTITTFQIQRGKWVPSAGKDHSLEKLPKDSNPQGPTQGSSDVTKLFPVTYENDSFSLKLDAAEGEGYLIKYVVKLDYTPISQEIVHNRIEAQGDGEQLINKVVDTYYQESSGEAEGYNYTIAVHKTSEDGENLEGAIFEVIRNATKAPVGRITTDKDGKGSLRGLLKDNYTIREIQAPEGYLLPENADISVAAAELTKDSPVLKEITNKKNPKITITGEKTWDDADNQDGKRPKEITVRLLANGQVSQSKVVTEGQAGKWVYSFTGLPKYDKQGQTINYSVSEVVVDDYTSKVTGYNITNSYTPGQTSVQVTKAWQDANNKDGVRPTGVTIHLYADGADTGKSLTLTQANNWTGTFTELDEYKAGQRIAYTVKEDAVDNGYTSVVTGTAGEGYVVTNTRQTEKVTVAGVKTWDDKENQDGKRPTSITINLLKNGTKIDSKVVTAADGWKWSFTNLDKYENGVAIQYSIQEETVAGYSSTINGYNITNSYTPGKTSVQVTKAWQDENNQDGVRPTSVTIRLYADGADTGKSLTLTQANNWTGTFTELDEYKAGQRIVYTVKEDAVDNGYTSVVTGTAGEGYVVTNTRQTEKVTVAGVKTWDDKENQDGKRPTSITINLLKNGTKIDSKVVTAADEWKWSFTNLDKYENGVAIQYSIQEETVAGYSSTINGYNITNSYTPGQTSVQVTKAWQDENNKDGVRPTGVTIHLYADGEDTGKSLTLTQANNWTGTFTELDEYKAGQRIAYTVKEDAVGKGYTSVVTGTAGEGYVVTNTRQTEKVTVAGVKTWDDKENQDGKRPTSITINLLKNGTKIDSKVVTAADEWKWSFTNLDKYENGVAIQYSIQEETVNGYSTTINGYNITNSYTPGQTSVQVTKAWQDENNQDGVRPTSVTIRLYADGADTGKSLTLTQANNWTGTFTELDEYKAGQRIVYTVKEDAVGNGYTSTVSGTAGEGYVVTNTRIPAETPVEPGEPPKETPEEKTNTVLPKTGTSHSAILETSLLIVLGVFGVSIIINRREKKVSVKKQ